MRAVDLSSMPAKPGRTILLIPSPLTQRCPQARPRNPLSRSRSSTIPPGRYGTAHPPASKAWRRRPMASCGSVPAPACIASMESDSSCSSRRSPSHAVRECLGTLCDAGQRSLGRLSLRGRQPHSTGHHPELRRARRRAAWLRDHHRRRLRRHRVGRHYGRAGPAREWALAQERSRRWGRRGCRDRASRRPQATPLGLRRSGPLPASGRRDSLRARRTTTDLVHRVPGSTAISRKPRMARSGARRRTRAFRWFLRRPKGTTGGSGSVPANPWPS